MNEKNKTPETEELENSIVQLQTTFILKRKEEGASWLEIMIELQELNLKAIKEVGE